jgi:hypothetical protein
VYACVKKKWSNIKTNEWSKKNSFAPQLITANKRAFNYSVTIKPSVS